MILKIIICSVLFSVYIISVSTADDSNHFTFKEETNSLYKIHNRRKSWIDAKTTCEGEDALLFYPESEDEIKMIKKWWDESTTENKNLNALFHIGITDAEIEGKYLTVDGIPIDDVYHIWHAGEPNNIRYITTDEDCAIMNKDLEMNDSVCNCSLEGQGNGWCYLPFICKKKLGGNKKKTDTKKTIDWTKYQYKESTHSFYKIHHTRRSWVEAKGICESEDAKLFYPDTIQELTMIQQLWQESDNKIKLKAFIHIGLTDSEVEGKFVTVDGKPISSVYHPWRKGEPSNSQYSDGDEDCVLLLYNLTINDTRCNCTLYGDDTDWCYLPFICKREGRI